MLTDKFGNEVGIGDWILCKHTTYVIVDKFVGVGGMLHRCWVVKHPEDNYSYDYISDRDVYLSEYDIARGIRV